MFGLVSNMKQKMKIQIRNIKKKTLDFIAEKF